MNAPSLLKAELPQIIDSTMISAFRSCPKKFFLEFCCGFRPGTLSIDLHAGACFATAIEVTRQGVWDRKLNLPDALELAHAAFLVAWGDFEIPEYKKAKTAKTMDRMWEAVEAYFAKWSPLTDHIQPYFTPEGKGTFEYTFSIPLEPAEDPIDWEHSDGHNIGMGEDYSPSEVFPLHPSGEPFLYSGRFDQLGKWNDRPCILDEKTTGHSIGTDWADQWNLRSQFMGYVWACQQGGIDLDTVAVRGIAIQKTQIPLEEAIKPFSQMIIAKWYEQLRRDLWRMRKMWDEQYFDYNFADACTSYGGCVFRSICGSQHEEMWTQDFVVRRWNPLLKNPISESQV